jgi:Protein of unknown function (DUF3048) N-terminal domain/Protein of unknown function (DUF3048) C-terminal domain
MRSRFFLSVVALAVIAAACGGGGGSVSAKHKQLPTTSSTQGPTVAPLTGLPDPTGQSLTRPALSVKIENAPESRPQTGLQNADVVYEQIVEGGITRFMAVFNSNIPPVVGPIRSGRIMDPDLAAPLGGIFVYSGGIQPTEDAIKATPGVNVIVDTGSGTALFRDKTKAAPHDLYGHTDQLLASGGKPTPPPALFQYLPANVPFTGDNVNAFTIKYDPQYGQPTYTWDPTTGTWKRSIGLAPFMTTDGGQVAPNNVIIQFVGSYLQSPESGSFNTIGNGDAWVFSAGKLIKGKWARTSQTAPTQFTDLNGAPIRLTPGRTWVEFNPSISVFGGIAIVPGAPSPPTLPTTTTTTKKKK